MTVLAGADAGGSSTVVAVVAEDQEVSRVTGPGAAVRPGRAMVSGSLIGSLVRDVLNRAGLLRADVLVVGAAGVGLEEDRVALRDALRLEDVADTLRVTTDYAIALEAAFGEGPGIVLLAGTGSVAVARHPDGTLVRQGGRGWQMGDEGGGYALGREALRAAGRAADERGPPTALVDTLPREARVGDVKSLTRWSVNAGTAEVGALARVLIETAESGDAVAGEILGSGADDLAGHLAPLVRDWPSDARPAPFALGGGLLRSGGYRDLVIQRASKVPDVAFDGESIDAVSGALAMARRLAP